MSHSQQVKQLKELSFFPGKQEIHSRIECPEYLEPEKGIYVLRKWIGSGEDGNLFLNHNWENLFG